MATMELKPVAASTANKRFVTIKMPVNGGQRFEWLVDGIPLMFDAPPGKKKGDEHEFGYLWDTTAPTADGKPAPVGAPGGGRWMYQVAFAGTNTNLMCLVLCLCGGIFTCCGAVAYACPADKRDEYHVTAPGGGHALVFDVNGKFLFSKALEGSASSA